jgi:hypothetical protein
LVLKRNQSLLIDNRKKKTLNLWQEKENNNSNNKKGLKLHEKVNIGLNQHLLTLEALGNFGLKRKIEKLRKRNRYILIDKRKWLKKKKGEHTQSWETKGQGAGMGLP